MNAIEIVLGIVIGIPVAIAMGIFQLVRGGFRLAAKAFASRETKAVLVQPAMVEPASAPAPGATTSAAGQVVTATVSQLRSVADKHVSVVFNDNFTASVSYHPTEQLVRRRVRAIKAPAAELMKHLYMREVFDLPDVQMTEGVTFEQAVLDTETIGKKFIEELLSAKEPKFFAFAPADQAKSAPVDPAESARALAILRGAVHAADNKAAEPVNLTAPEPDTTVSVRPNARRTGTVTTGRVISFGMKKMMFQSKVKSEPDRPGETFEALIEMDDGEQAALRGVVLQEKFKEQDVRVDDYVEIHSLGQTQVTVGKESKKRNEFEVKILARA